MIISFDEEKHVYTDELGTIYPNPTSIIGKVYGTGLENAPSYFVERAANKGHFHHGEFDTYLKTGKQGESPEFKAWHEWFSLYSQPFTKYESEKIVFANTPHGAFAGTLDFYGNGFIYDWKTCKTANRQQVKKWQMQLSFYCYAMRQMGYEVNEPLKIVHVNGNELEVINVDYLGDAFVEETMRLYKEGAKPETPVQELQTVSKTDMQVLEDVLMQIKALEAVANNYREKIKEEMEQRGILNLQIGKVKIAYVGESTRKSFDSKAFKADHNDLYLQYIKESTVKPTVRVSVD